MIKSLIDDFRFEEIISFFSNNFLKNRTIVTSDISTILDDIENFTGLPLKRYKYKTNEEYATWVIPPQWDIKEAWLKNSKGELVASYLDHPLFVCPYSKNTREKLSKKDLLSHVTTASKQPDAYAYNWRFAYDANLRLKEWGLSLPSNLLEKLPEDEEYEVYIHADVKDGEMLVGDITVTGESDETIVFAADYCHPGQVNDSFSGLGLFMQVMKSLSKIPNRRYTYKLLVFPETIGAVAYIVSHQDEIKTFKGTIFSEMVGWGENWYLKKTREGNTYMDQLAENISYSFSDVSLAPFFSLYQNDELIFNSVNTNIPSLALLKHPFDEIHTSFDTPDRVREEDMRKAFAIILNLIFILERDDTYRQTNPVPFWMTRYNLYSEKTNSEMKHRILYEFLDGNKSLLEIANLVAHPFEEVYEFAMLLKEQNLIEPAVQSDHIR